MNVDHMDMNTERVGTERKQKLRINTQQIVFFVTILILMFGIGLWTTQLSGTVTSNISQTKNQNIKLASVAQQMRVDVIQIQQWLTDISATRGLDGLDDGFKEAESSYRSFIDGLDEFKKAYQDGGKSRNRSQLSELKENLDSYYSMGKKMAQAYVEGGPASGNLMMSQFDTAAEDMYEALDPFVEEQVNGMTVAMDGINDSVLNLRLGIVIMFSIAIVVVIVGIFAQNRSANRRMQKVLESLESTAEGDLTIRLDERGKDEMTSVAIAFNNLIEKITAVISEVKQTSDIIFEGSQEISTGATDLSQRTEEQASSLEETASSMEEMTATVRQNAESAQEASLLADTARNEAEKGGAVVQNAVDAMEEINESSSRIADITATIDSIAFQTNLLALNAAVEAARAGDQGRGFAVVAAEVRTLAQHSADAAKEIKGLIEDSSEKVRAGTELVGQSGETLRGILDGVNKVADIVAEISAASQEQSSSIDQVNRAVMQMDNMTQQNAAMVEESAAASRSMEERSSTLVEAVGYFRTESSTR